ncbi:craniofacial development protein 2-like [Sipha flava]|jgi:hypothetical protein|uniref:Craniofacial development protein 2-like n=1 Tax=Sipha flava TaxID=143950 RepID=A0A8B8G596_9HEMI|nr:craniofacial development protein 2-like [Sipha flava]
MVMESRLENWKLALHFGTWNIRTLYQPGALTLVKEFNKYRLETLAIQEIRWSGQGSTEIGNAIFFGQCDNCRQGSTGFIVKKNVVPVIKDFKIVNSRLFSKWRENSSKLHLSMHMHRLKIKVMIKKEELYSLLEFLDIALVLLGDFNTKINKEECFKTATRSNSLHQLSNNNGFKLIELATVRGLKIKST